MNSQIIKGRLSHNPELKSVDVKGESKSVCSFDVAVDKNFGEGVDFFKCQIWGKRAEFVDKFFSKGQEILVQGSHESRQYKDKDGNNRIAWELKAERVEFCGSKKDNAAASSTSATNGVPEGFIPQPDDDDDIPF